MIVGITRERFVEIIDGEIETALTEDDALESYVGDLRHIARTMNRFAMGSWFSRRANCGCLVGEGFRRGTLPTRDAGGRQQFAPRWGTDLYLIGADVDTAMYDEVERMVGHEGALHTDIVVILDGGKK